MMPTGNSFLINCYDSFIDDDTENFAVTLKLSVRYVIHFRRSILSCGDLKMIMVLVRPL